MPDKIRIAEGLAEAGVHRIEAGIPVVSPSDAAAIKEIVKRNLGPQIFAFSRCMVDDVKRAVDCGVKGVVMEVPSSEHIIKYAYKWSLEKAIDLSIESTKFAHEQGLEVVFFQIDFSRAEMNWVLDLIQKVATQGHMDALALVDVQDESHGIYGWVKLAIVGARGCQFGGLQYNRQRASLAKQTKGNTR